MIFSSIHIASGTNIDTNFFTVPANATYTIENVYLAGEQAGTMIALECPNNGLMIAHQKAPTGGPFTTQFTNLDAVVSGGTGGTICVVDRTSAGQTEHTYVQAQYLPYDATVEGTAQQLNASRIATQNYVQFGIDIIIIALFAILMIKALTWRNWLSDIVSK